MSGLLLLPVLAEILAVLRTKGAIRLYFLLQLIATPILWWAELTLGKDVDAYRVIYSILTLLVLAASFQIVWEAGTRLSWLMAALFASGGLIFTFGHPKSLDFWIVLVEGCLLLFIGAGLAFRAPFSKDSRLVVLSVLWLLMAIYDFHWLMNPRVPQLDVLAPPYLMTIACLYCAFFSHQMSHPTLPESHPL